MLARAMSVNGLDQLVAVRILRSPTIGQFPPRIRLAVLALRLVGLAWVWNAFTLVLATLALLLLTGFLLIS